MPPRRLLSSSSGQASVELVAALPFVLLLLAAGLQAVLAGEVAWQARGAARAAARAHAVGADPSTAARSHLASRLERGLTVTPRPNGEVGVSVRVPTLLPSLDLGRTCATSTFRPQS